MDAAELEENGIVALTTKSDKFPNAQFCCELCSYHLDDLRRVKKHILQSDDHKKMLVERQKQQRLEELPSVSKEHATALSAAIESVAAEHGRQSAQLDACSRLAMMLTRLFQQEICSDLNVRIYGSSATGMALVSSDLNLELIRSEGSAMLLSTAFDLIEQLLTSHPEKFCEVHTEYTSRFPSIRFRSTHEEVDVECALSVPNELAYDIGQLIHAYVNFEPNLVVLGRALRYWAQLCSFEKCGLPPHALDLMLIHSLQQNDYLPVLSVKAPHSVDSNSSSSGRHWELGEIWLGFFKQYALSLKGQDFVVQITQRDLMYRDQKNWSKKRLAIEDPFRSEKNLVWQSQLQYEYVLQILQRSFAYFGIPCDKNGPVVDFGSIVSDNYRDALELIDEKHQTMKLHDYAYPFEQGCFVGDLTIELPCDTCSAFGHVTADCPKNAPDVRLYPLAPENVECFDALIEFMIETSRLKLKDDELMRSYVEELRVLISAAFPLEHCRLELFGSVANGFAFLQSDMDVCLRFECDRLPADMTVADVLTKVAAKLTETGDFQQVVPVLNAKVPIVKFTKYKNNVDGDISVRNVKAVRNSQLLRMYAEIDVRVKQLGIMVKIWAKWCNIGDASKGSLSSYAYIILMIHYLQHCHHPVLPFLQEMGNADGRKEEMVENCNTYFFSSMTLLRMAFRTENRQSVYQLWLGFLQYYLEAFDFGSAVVQIRSSNVRRRLDKGWYRKPMAIEDPFDLNHNLASGVDVPMFAYIKHSIANALMVFGNDPFPFSEKPINPIDYHSRSTDLLEWCCLPDSPPVPFNACHICHRIGHFSDSCPDRV